MSDSRQANRTTPCASSWQCWGIYFGRRFKSGGSGQFPGRSMPFTQLRDELLVWLLAVPLKPKPVLCYDSDCDYELVTHLLGGPLPRGWKHENVFLKIDAERLAH